MKQAAIKYQLACCALCQITCGNTTPPEEILFILNKLKNESRKKWSVSDRSGGERAAFVIVSPGEDELERKLKIIGFKKIATFDRRNGYPEGKNKMYLITI